MIFLALAIIAVCRLIYLVNHIARRLKHIERLLTHVTVGFYTTIDGIKKKVDHMNLKVSQKLPISITITDAQGNPAQVDGAPVWSVTAPELADVVASDDGMSAVVTPKGVSGTLQVQVNADADLGTGVKTIIGMLDLELISSEAVMIALAAGEPSDI